MTSCSRASTPPPTGRDAGGCQPYARDDLDVTSSCFHDNANDTDIGFPAGFDVEKEVENDGGFDEGAFFDGDDPRGRLPPGRLTGVRWGMRLRAALVASTLAACQLDAAYDGTSFRCEQACPAGQACVGGVCRPGGAAALDAAALSAYAAEVLEDEPLLYLRLDETEGDVASDSSGAGRHGAYTSGAAHEPDGAFDTSGGAVHVDGVGGRVTVPDDEALRLNGDFTIEMWVKLDEMTNTFPGVVHKGGADETDSGFIIYYTEGGNQNLVLKRDGNDGNGVMGEPLTAEGYRHYVLTYDISEFTARWYVDGGQNVTYTETTWGENTNVTQLSFGRADEYGKQWLDEIAVYDTALAAERVQAHHDAATLTSN